MTCQNFQASVIRMVKAGSVFVDIDKASAFDGLLPEDRQQVGLAVAHNVSHYLENKKLPANLELKAVTCIEHRAQYVQDLAANQQYEEVILTSTRSIFVVTTFLTAGAPCECANGKSTTLRLSNTQIMS